MSLDAPMPFIPAVDDGWAILSEPPGARDLAVPDHWRHSLERSRRRRDARRPDRGSVRVGATLAVLALGGGTVSAAVAAPEAAAAKRSSSTLERGDRGAAVVALQARLGISADGVFGPQTERAVKRFQRRNGLAADGVVGPLTSAALGRGARPKAKVKAKVKARAHRAPKAAAPPAVALSPAAARAMQAELGVAADGVVGPQTRKALRRFERRNGLPADGRPDAQVLQALGVDPDAAAPAPEAPSGANGAAAAARHALAKTGTPYASGGNGPGSFDCSGLTLYAFKKAGISLPRTSFAQYGMGRRVKRSQIRVGDLVFFDTAGSGASHVGIATGNDTVVSATTRGVMEHAISDGYWGSHYVGARRV